MSLYSVLWTRSSTLGERSRNTQGEQTSTDNEHNAENNHNACFAGSPVLSLDEEAVDGIAGSEGCESCHFWTTVEVSWECRWGFGHLVV
jgi:hypothetical protein